MKQISQQLSRHQKVCLLADLSIGGEADVRRKPQYGSQETVDQTHDLHRLSLCREDRECRPFSTLPRRW